MSLLPPSDTRQPDTTAPPSPSATVEVVDGENRSEGNPLSIRNIIQSVQEREVIKTAPDMVVYIEGLPFIVNDYLQQSDKDMVTVNFNDYITSITTSYSIDSYIPTGSITLSVPNGMKHLFMAPGGNTIFQVMSAVRIYAKCYYFSESGNTVLRRVFNGLIKNLTMNETPTGLEIQLSIAGILRLMEIAQIELQPALMTQSSWTAQIFRSNQANLSVYQAIHETFNRALDFSEFTVHAFDQRLDRNTPGVSAAILKNYVYKWTLRLNDLRRDVRLFGSKEFAIKRNAGIDEKNAKKMEK